MPSVPRVPQDPAREPGDARALMLYEANKKSLLVSYVLWFLIGALGAHRFYNGRPGSGALMALLSVGGFMLLGAFGLGLILLAPVWIWVVVDAFLIPGWVAAHNDRLARELAGP
ncbi:MAG TPA: TM2 domain-containing protein [Beijerinckiaceae bacterium]|nr:TM2 domain-containing protein [Beijerinckiaceae bacterium]